MSSPVTSDDLKANLPSVTDQACDQAGKLLKLITQLYEIAAWMLDNEGNLTDDFKANLGLATSATLQAPSNLTATGASTSIVLAWDDTPAAESYSVYRSDTDTPPDFTAPRRAGLTTSDFTDSDAFGDFTVGKTYFYWVVAYNAGGHGPYSTVASAHAGDTASPQDFGYSSQGVEQTFTVPLGVTSLSVLADGGGAGGGTGYVPSPWSIPIPPGTPTGAGGGGGGGERRTVTLSVSHGDTIAVIVGKGGDGGVKGSGTPANGSAGGDTIVKVNGAEQIRARGGQPGHFGTQNAGGTGGNGGTGGTGGSGTSNAGDAGTTAGPGAGGAPVGSYGGGGAGGPSGGNGVAGADGHVTISWV